MNKTALRIKKIRNELGLSRKDLANKVGVSISSVESWELGRRVPSWEIFDKLSPILHATKSYLVGTSDDRYGIEEWSKNTGYSVSSLKKDLEKLIASGGSSGDLDKDIATVVVSFDEYNDTSNEIEDNLQMSLIKSIEYLNKIENEEVANQLQRFSEKKFNSMDATAIANGLDFLITAFEKTRENQAEYFSAMVSLGQIINNNNDDYEGAIKNITDLIRFIEKQNKKASDDKPETER